jgi:copper chaperone CopZ
MRFAFSLGRSLLVVAALATTVAAQAPTVPDDASAASAMKALKVRQGETVIFVEDLHCATCAKKVTSRLFKVKGVMRVRTSVKLDAAVVTPQSKKPLDPAAAWAALQAAGYQPTQLIGPEGVFVPHDETKEPFKIAEAPDMARK